MPRKSLPKLSLFFVGFILISLFCLQCRTPKSTVTQQAFYYWETGFSLEVNDINYLADLHVQKLYIHFFDIDYQSGPIPVGSVRFETKMPAQYEIVPVVFITNKTILNLDSAGIKELALKINTRLQKEIQRTQIASQVKEWQMDCDWTQSSKNKYFYLLSLLRSMTHYTLSATIRLHQYKYFKNNLPPVEKGILMCYNVNDPAAFNVSNSLFNKEEVMKYVEGVKYPLPLDLAVPAFSWGVLFNENKEFAGLINSVRLTDVAKDTSFERTGSSNVFVCKYSHYDLMGSYREIPAGYTLRVEESNAAEVKELVAYMKEHLQQENATISIFHYDRLNKKHENKKDLLQIFNAAH